MAEPQQTTRSAAGAQGPGRPRRRPSPLATAGAALASFLGALALLAHQASSDGDPADAAADAAGSGRPVVVRIEEWRIVRRVRRPAAAADRASGEGVAAADVGDSASAPAPAPADGAPAPDPEPAPLVSRGS